MDDRSIDLLKYFTARKNICLLEYIANILSLQYYKDENTITLSSEKFVIDINCVVKVYFVKEDNKFKNVDNLLNRIYERRNFYKFYMVIKDMVEERDIDYAKYIETIKAKEVLHLLMQDN